MVKLTKEEVLGIIEAVESGVPMRYGLAAMFLRSLLAEADQ